MTFAVFRVVMFAAIMTVLSVSNAGAQNVKGGELVFKQCVACHALEAGKNDSKLRDLIAYLKQATQ